MSKISYSAVVLDEKSKQKLVDKFKSIIPKNWKILANHMTINLGEIDPNYEKYLGMNIRLSVDDVAMNNNVIAVGVSNFPSKKPKPHITIAVNSSNNAKSNMSDALTDWKDIERPFFIVGKVTEVEFNLE